MRDIQTAASKATADKLSQMFQQWGDTISKALVQAPNDDLDPIEKVWVDCGRSYDPVLGGKEMTAHLPKTGAALDKVSIVLVMITGGIFSLCGLTLLISAWRAVNFEKYVREVQKRMSIYGIISFAFAEPIGRKQISDTLSLFSQGDNQIRVGLEHLDQGGYVWKRDDEWRKREDFGNMELTDRASTVDTRNGSAAIYEAHGSPMVNIPAEISSNWPLQNRPSQEERDAAYPNTYEMPASSFGSGSPSQPKERSSPGMQNPYRPRPNPEDALLLPDSPSRLQRVDPRRDFWTNGRPRYT